MLDLNNDSVFFKDDSVTSNTDSNSSSFQPSLSTLNFSILKSDRVFEIEDESSTTGGGDMLTRQLFPVKGEIQGQSQCWLNLSVSESAGLEVPVYKPPVHKKSRRGPRSRSSQYRGVTFYRRTGRWESHIWYLFFFKKKKNSQNFNCVTYINCV